MASTVEKDEFLVDKEKVSAFISQHAPAGIFCTVCQKNRWGIMDHFYEVRDFRGRAMTLGGGHIVPMVVLICETCGQMIFFNALAIGVLKLPTTGDSTK